MYCKSINIGQNAKILVLVAVSLAEVVLLSRSPTPTMEKQLRDCIEGFSVKRKAHILAEIHMKLKGQVLVQKHLWGSLMGSAVCGVCTAFK